MEGVDAGYLYMETPTMHMHTLKIALLEPPHSFELERLEHELLARLEHLPPLRRRALPAPFHLNHPLWVTDQPVDPAHHVFAHEVPAPGGMEGLHTLIGRVAGTPLDRTRPLWEMHVCQPFGDNRIAVITKMHHALADGNAANALLGNIVDGFEDRAPSGPEELEPTPTWLEQIRLALVDAILQIGRLPGLVTRTLRAIVSVLRHRRASTVQVPRPLLDVPRTPFNGALTSRRNFCTTSLPLDQLREVKEAHGVTLNDVVLGVVGGALKRFLASRGELPSRSLVAGVPVGTDDPGSGPRLGGNRVSNIFTSLATDLDDPHERLQAISRTTGESKLIHQTLGANMLVDWVQFAPPAPLTAAMQLYSRSRAASYHPPPFNAVVSNVRGPGEPVSISGAPLRDLFSVGPILEGIGLNITAWSYVDRMNFSFLGCPDLVPDLAPLVAELPRALDELRTTKGVA
jgi:diacylglycerol O-acyltransferase / wax synthase